ncbi:glutathione S-transferase [Polymorphobacter glacialis]|uniref:Glutathione S-transferase n=1 Tax=Sandarakinorhabdus glacialis TaxID=1614636 RepID=A0A917E5T4_9SPHN|nr:glutathione S-transferase N-terminal domain-containing protein [Polymorphobacter glacialis]GGE07580.1 glutathione S-transferase [Polymorphobacter glacialis]
MKLYFSPGACSLAAHVALHEAGAAFDSESVDLKAKRTASGADFNAITAEGYVPVLILDNGELLTENVAVLDYLASQYPQLGLEGPLGRTRLLEALAFISSEIHKSFKPFFGGGGDSEKADAGAYVTKRMTYFAERVTSDYLFGDAPSVADFYLLVTMLWAERLGIVIPGALVGVLARLKARPAVLATLKAEGLA